MIVTCPACATRFFIDPRALGPTGRAVRCTQCDHVWTQLPPEDAPRRVDPMAAGAAKAAPVPAMAMAAADAFAAPSPLPEPELPRDMPPSSPPPVPPRQNDIGNDPTVARGSSLPLIIMAVLVLILGGLWYGHDAIVDAVPALDGVYRLVGLGTGDAKDAFEFRDVASNRQLKDGRATLTITGAVANVSRTARRVPPVRITLEDNGHHPIKSWTVVATEDRLPPGQSVSFRSSVTDPGAGSVGASVTFEPEND